MSRLPSRPAFPAPKPAAVIALIAAATAVAEARPWKFKGIAEPVEAEFVAENNGYVVLRGENDKSFELPLANFSTADQDYIRALSTPAAEKGKIRLAPKPITRGNDYKVTELEKLGGSMFTPPPSGVVHLGDPDDPIGDTTVNFTASDGWIILDAIPPSKVDREFLGKFLINGAEAETDGNIRLVQYGPGTAVIPHGPDFPALTAYGNPDLGGQSTDLQCYVKYGEGELKEGVSSFVLRRGYMATLAENADGTGVSQNWVAQDHDVVVEKMPKGLDSGIRFVRVFPWRWTGKKGIAGGIHQNLGVKWFYDWNIGARSSLDLEYVAIKQKRYWPGLDQDWKAKGINHLLGYNEPDRPDQANMSVDEAIQGWPELLGTGLRIGSPATSDGGLGWLYEFMDKADRAGLRVDFVAVHYYRGIGNPGDEKSAASQLYDYLKRIHDRVKRPIWITEWNNGANWTTTPDPNEREQAAAIREMIEMLDETPFVERYAPYNWVEPCRELVRKDGSLTPAGVIYRDQVSPVFFVQP